MTAIRQKNQIISSLNGMDQKQMEQVQAYIRSVAAYPSEEQRYQSFRNEEMRQIRHALKEGLREDDTNVTG
jgi:hypothetical protein